MSVRRIRLLGDPVLREVARPVEDVDEEVQALIDDLLDTMYDADGIGLAAPQIGVPLSVFVYDVREPEVAPGALVNPRLVETNGQVKEEEGCLSIPDLREIVPRAERVVVEGLDRDGHEVRLEAEGLLGRCLQHELDHLAGVLFIDRVSPLKRKMLLNKWSKRESDTSAARAM
ncbi:MAG: peptide deformylase [Gemmatimonadota bacterium]|nr:MAG: peptide deformylase [Gemmatimonadota bacterium]